MKKLGFNFIKEQFKSEGYTLITDVYKGAHTKLQVKCPNKHLWETTWNNWKKGRRCKKCGRFLDIEKLYDDISKEGYKILNTDTIKTVIDEFEIECPNKHKYTITASRWYGGARCRRCHFDNLKVDFERFVKLLNEASIEVLEVPQDVFDSRTKVLCRCLKCGNTFYKSWSLILRGHRCKSCAYKKLAKDYKLDYNDISTSFELEGYNLLSDSYKNAFSKLKYNCPNGHVGFIRWNDWQQGCRCNRCGISVSKGHNDIIHFLEEAKVNYNINNRKIITPYELDIVIPDKKIAIEYCGLYWHSELNGKDKNYHLDKLKLCEEKGYRLITIFEDEWVFNVNIVKSRLANILGIQQQVKFYARKCQIKEISAKEAKNFCEENHLQGYGAGSKVKLGLFHDKDLVAVMTFSKPSLAKGHKKAKDEVWELHRFCSKLNTQVIGGASKLFKHFERNYNWKEVFSYADRRWSTGNLYKQLGFGFAEFTKPNYWYTYDGKERIHRFNLRKNCNIHKNISEKELRSKEGYYRVWDCGNFKFKLKENEL